MKLLIITGTPGSGKTTISNKLNDLLNCKSISLNELVISKNFIINYDEERDTHTADFKILIPYVLSLIREIKKKNPDYLIIEGHFADIIPNNLIDIVFILKCHPDVLLKRLIKRNYKKG